MLTDPSSSNFSSGGASFLHLLDTFLFDVSGGSSRNLTSGMNGIYSTYSATMACGGIYVVMYSIMGITKGVLVPYYETIIVLEIEMTILFEKSPWLLQLQTQQLNVLRCNRMNETSTQI